ncbi:MAG TPA: hypothetical protein VF981_01370, partial [Gemmatimonadaceae bacterium]
VCLSVVIHQLDFVGLAVTPLETEAPLIRHPNAPLTLPVATELFEPISRKGSEVFKANGSVQHSELAKTGLLQLGAPTADRFTAIEPFRVLVTEAPDHLR